MLALAFGASLVVAFLIAVELGFRLETDRRV